MRQRSPLNTGWIFHAGFDPAWITLPLPGPSTRLPHAAVSLPWNYGNEHSYQQPFTYQRILHWDPRFAEGEVVLHAEGAMAGAKVWINGELVADHPDGYTPFEAWLSDHLIEGENLLTIHIDGSENPDIPPFGGRIDYLTYAGIYRDVWLDIRPAISIKNAKISVDDPLADQPVARVDVWLDNPKNQPVAGAVLLSLVDEDGTVIRDLPGFTIVDNHAVADVPLGTGLVRWSPRSPALHRLKVKVKQEQAEDSQTIRFGLREAVFRPDGFFLNGEPFKIRGLNRHQSFPHVGYALGPEAQAHDADILKFELGCNLVRTSHYPQSKAFLDRCDEIGLLVFEEIPGWQHIGGEAFRAQSVKNVEAMIERDWNHPSIVLWGVRINESQDDDAFYEQTNATARALDGTRQTGGVRYISESNLLEDGYTLNDFVLGEEHLPEFLQSRINRPRTPLRDQREVTGLAEQVPYLVSEYNGHMYPTKVFDGEERQEEHVLRHLEVMDAAAADPHIAGSIGWCMFDYNTHADFGSGDRICYHGVMTMGRAPKFAAFAYASQGFSPSERPILEPATHWSFGDRKVGGVFPLVILTNCDAVTFHYGDDEPLTFLPAYSRFPHLPHPPVIIEATDIPEDKRIVWGQTWRDGLFGGLVGDKVVIERYFLANPLPTALTMETSPVLRPQDAYHDRLIRITARDQAGNRLPFMMDQLAIAVEGPGTVQGPATIPLIGGVAACWVRTTGDELVSVTATPLSHTLPPTSITLDG